MHTAALGTVASRARVGCYAVMELPTSLRKAGGANIVIEYLRLYNEHYSNYTDYSTPVRLA